MKALQELKDYAESKDDWYIKSKIWYIEKQHEIAIHKAKIEVYKQVEKNRAFVVLHSEQLTQSCSVCDMTKHPILGANCKASNCPNEH
tara:strand:+ start:51 stop:314 length:264 start_codon:yes stop_codon:yes gene_type:complete